MTISLPASLLTYPQIDPIALQIGPLAIRWYGLAYMSGILLGWLYLRRLIAQKQLWRSGKPAMSFEKLDDYILWITLGIVLGGRLGYVLFYEPANFAANPAEIVKLWKGGMSFHGGLIGVGLASYLFAKVNKLSLLPIMDLVAAAAPIGLFFGRIANFINGGLVGRESNVPWAMIFPGYGNAPRHPSQLYEAILEGLILFIILRLAIYAYKALQIPGRVCSLFLIGYGYARIFCEFFRRPELHQYSTISPLLTAGMIYSIPMVLGGMILYHQSKKFSAGKA